MIKRLMISLSLIVCIITCGIFAWYYYARFSIIPSYEKNFSTILNDRASQVSTYLNEQEKYALQLSQEATIITALSSSKKSDKLAHSINTHKETMGFKNILLVDKQGTIIFSTTQKDLGGTNLKEYTNSSLGKSYERATMTLTNDFSTFNFNELLQEPALFITIPILKEKKYIGTVSYQLDEEKIYSIANQYIGLGKTGEVTLGEKEGQYIVFVAPTRNDPDLAFKKRMLFTYPPLAIQASVLGQEGSGSAIDYRGKAVVGAWKFIPRLDWGMMVKIDLDEIMQSTLMLYKMLLVFLLICLISLLFTFYLFRRHIHKKMVSLHFLNTIPTLCKNPLFIFCIIFFCLAIKNIIQCRNKQSSVVKKAQQQAQENNEKNADNSKKLLEKVAFVGQSIAQDLHTNYLKKEDIKTRIERDLSENNIITTITVAYSPYSYDHTIESYIQTTSPDLVKNTTLFETKWYKEALEKNITWIVNPAKNTDRPTATYACTFNDTHNKPIGVIAITFSLDTIIDTIASSSIGQTGYSFITTETGAFIFHPISTLVKNHITFLQFAQANGNEELASIAQKTLSGNPLSASYTSHTTKEKYWITTQPIAANKWIIGTIFAENEIGLQPQKIRLCYFWILVWFVIALLFLISLVYTYTYISEIAYAILINLILLSGLITAWYTITITHTINKKSAIIVTDQSSLNKFLNDLSEEAQRKHEPNPINVPCGLLLYSINIPDPDHMEISGYLWTKYNTTEHKDITRGIDVLQSTRISIGKPLTSITGDWETETWTVQGLLSQDQQNAHYPFDQQQLCIILEHRDIEKNIILTPDLVGYKQVSPDSTPGLDKDFSISGFTVEQTFFEYKQFDPRANFGFKEYGKVTDHFQLIYNVILTRNLLTPFVIYMLPLLVILFALFFTLLMTTKKTDAFSMLGVYTGLFLTLIVLQRSLREQHPSGSTLYMEYVFFYIYITIILLILHTILNHFYQNKATYHAQAFHLMKLLFWPFQLISWLITTLVVFY